MLLLLFLLLTSSSFQCAWLTSAQTKTYNLCDPVSMAMHAGCRCSGTEAEGGYSIQSYSLLREGDNSGWGVSSLNPEAMHLISSASETCIQYQLIREDLCVEWSNNGWRLLLGNLFSHRSSNSLLEGPESTLMWIICCNCSEFYCMPSCIKLSYICREFG